MENLFLIAGLGNPGADYASTRHNAGFLAVEKFGARHQARWAVENDFRARVARVHWEGQRLLLCEPQTYMNSSGAALGSLAKFYRIVPERSLIVVDDADLPFGEIRLRARGSSGGHHGLESIETAFGTRDYPRLRIGIGRRAEAGREITDYVLSRFSAEEKRRLDLILDRVCQQAECWIKDGPLKAMNHFNGLVDDPAKAKES